MANDKKELEKLELNKLEAKDGVLTIQHQTLPTPHLETLHEVESVNLEGTISAPANWYTKRKAQTDNLKSNVTYNFREREITLVTKEDFSNLGYSITGKLIINPAIKMLGINEEKTFFVGELVKHLRKNKFYFAEESEWKKIIDGLQNFSANVNQEIKKISTNNGNMEDLTKITMKSNLELTFKLAMPVFIGEKTETFPVEIACDATSTSIKFWLESPDLIMLLDQNTQGIINAELARLKTDSNDELVFIEQ